MISLFAQDEFFLIPSRLSLTGGIKVQDFLNTAKDSLAIQPQARLLWTPTRSSSFWAAVSRAVRTPSEVERDLYFSFPIPSQNGIPVEGLLSGNPALPGEVVIAYEAGYRRQLGKRLSLDIAAFYNHYTNLIQTINQAPYLVFAPGPEVIAPETYASTGGADTRGVELAASWSPRRNWRLQVSYAWETASFEAPVSLSLTVPPGAAWATPAQTTSVRSSWDVTRRWSVDSSVYGVSAITDQSVPGYARVDLRVARKLGEGGEFSAGAQNLFDEKHVEFRSEDYLISSYLRRNVFVKIVWRF
jgi:iron complex outermembrane receptor protein